MVFVQFVLSKIKRQILPDSNSFLHPYYGVKKAGAPDVFGAPALHRV
jgi:hypothetical protein